MKNLGRLLGPGAISCLALVLIVAPGGASVRAQLQAPAIDLPALRTAAQQRGGRVKVIVMLRVPVQPEGLLTAAAAASQRAAVAFAQQTVISRLAANASDIRRFAITPGFATDVDGIGLLALASDPSVARVVEDVPVPPALAQSVPLINADDVWAAGHTGAAQTIAVLDTGVDKTHEFLDDGKVVSEACYSTTHAGDEATTLCPNGTDTDEGPGAGVNCTGLSGCGHGTHVAGIAAGTGSAGGFHGVAPNAGVIAIQVFSRFRASSSFCGGSSDCLLAYTSDTIRGLERVFALRNTHDIASVNMSLGGGGSFGHCDDNPHKPIIDSLRSIGISTVIASGNDGATSSINAPACVSTAISVGSTTKGDVVSDFSNSSSVLHLLAPGSAITSSIPGNTYASSFGTSMATPHVAGAIALIKGSQPALTVTQILTALQGTGVPITDNRAGATRRVKPRIDVVAALNAVRTDAVIDSLYPVSDAAPGATVTLWAQVRNAGVAAFPSGTVVWFWTDGPRAGSSNWIGSTSVAGLGPGATAWYSYEHTIPSNAAGGSYVYWGQVWTASASVSAWKGPQSYSLDAPTAVIDELFPIPNAAPGTTVRMWAKVRNTGVSAHPAGSQVWFWTNGPSWSGTNWIGSASTAGLAPGASTWYFFDWLIPPGASPGSYYTYAQVWSGGTNISPWQGPQFFNVASTDSSRATHLPDRAGR